MIYLMECLVAQQERSVGPVRFSKLFIIANFHRPWMWFYFPEIEYPRGIMVPLYNTSSGRHKLMLFNNDIHFLIIVGNHVTMLGAVILRQFSVIM